MHARHRISAKIALYSEDAQRVLVMYYPKKDIYGLPGGHIDKGEEADTAMARELQEELGVSVDTAVHADFFYIKRLILGYTAIVPTDFKTFPPRPTKEHAVWRTKDEVVAIEAISAAYKSFILDHWPTSK